MQIKLIASALIATLALTACSKPQEQAEAAADATVAANEASAAMTGDAAEAAAEAAADATVAANEASAAAMTGDAMTGDAAATEAAHAAADQAQANAEAAQAAATEATEQAK